MARKRLILSVVANTVSYATSGAVTLVLTPFLISTIGKDAYSFYPLAMSIVLYMEVLSLALNSMAARFVMMSFSRKDEAGANTYFSSVFRSNLLLAGVLAPLVVVFVVKIDTILNIPRELLTDVRTLFALVMTATLVRLSASTFGIAVFVKDRLDLRATIDFFVSLIRMALYFTLFTVLPPSVTYVGIVVLAVELLSLAANLAVTRKLLPQLRFWGDQLNVSAVREVVGAGVWISLRHLGAILLSYLALLLANIYLGSGSSGDYGIALTAASFLSGFIGMIGGLFMPRAVHLFAVDTTENLVKGVTRAQEISGALAAVAVGVYIVLARDFFRLWVPGEDAGLLVAISALTVAVLPLTGATWPLTNLNIAMNQLRAPAVAMLLGGAASAVLSFLTLRYTDWGVVGLALASVAPNFVLVLLFAPLYPCRGLSVPWTSFYAPVVKTAVAFGSVVAAAAYLRTLLEITSWGGLALVALAAAGVGIALAGVLMLGPRVAVQEVRLLAGRIRRK